MNWVLLALVSPFLWAIMSILQKILRTKHLNSSVAFLVISSVFRTFIICTIALLFFTVKIPTIWIGLLTIITGIIQALGTICYYKALSLEEVSRVVPLLRLESLFVIILATIFLSESLTLMKYLAFLLIFIGGFLVSVKNHKKIFHLSTAFYLMLLASFLFGTGAVILKYLSTLMNYQSYFFVGRIGFVLTGFALVFIPKQRKKIIQNLKILNKKTIIMIFLMEIFALSGYLIFTYTITLAPITLVNVLLGFQPLFVLVLASFLSFKFPNILKEELNKKVLLTKIFATVLLITGLFLIQNGVH